jgi:phenylacetate-coenzyme A ligase PaaK-like adenylate-forming protein
MALPDDAEDIIKAFFGIGRMVGGYGMTELNAYLLTCEHDRLHLPPWVTALLLDPNTGQPLPRTGEQTGRAAFFDMSHDGAWGGIVTGDRISINYAPCGCGRSTLHLAKKIARFSDLTGDEDKLTCAAAPSAQSAALDYLTGL